MNSTDRIKHILTEQMSAYRALLDVLQRERECLLHFDALSVEALSKEKDTVVLRVRLLEDERHRLASAFADEHGVAEGDVFRKLSEIAGDDSLQAVRLQLISLLQSIVELNSVNRVLIDRSAGVVKNALNFLGSAGIAVPAAHKGALLSREA